MLPHTTRMTKRGPRRVRILITFRQKLTEPVVRNITTATHPGEFQVVSDVGTDV